MAFQKPKVQPTFADLKGILSQSNKLDNPSYQLLQTLIERLVQFQNVTVSQIEGLTKNGGGSGGGAAKEHAVTHKSTGSDPVNILDLAGYVGGTALFLRADRTFGPATGPQGPAGPQGPQGMQGVPGPVGPTGPIGPQGIQGLTGPQGVKGDTGDTGPQGPIGNTGPQGPEGDPSTVPGPQGPQGPIGETGPIGPEGPASTVPGPAGPQGPIGPQGIQGIKGDTGATGPQGPQGIQGLTGPTGPEGPEGPASTVPGPAGPQGIQGIQGPIGPEGPKGDTGDTGPQGIPGPEGPQGPAGTVGPHAATHRPGGGDTIPNVAWTDVANTFTQNQTFNLGAQLPGNQYIQWNTGAVVAGPPTLSTRSAGTKLVLYPDLSASATDRAIGIEAGAVWFGVSALASVFKWYGGTSQMMTLTNNNLTVVGQVTAGPGLFNGRVTIDGATITPLTSQLELRGGIHPALILYDVNLAADYRKARISYYSQQIKIDFVTDSEGAYASSTGIVSIDRAGSISTGGNISASNLYAGNGVTGVNANFSNNITIGSSLTNNGTSYTAGIARFGNVVDIGGDSNANPGRPWIRGDGVNHIVFNGPVGGTMYLNFDSGSPLVIGGPVTMNYNATVVGRLTTNTGLTSGGQENFIQAGAWVRLHMRDGSQPIGSQNFSIFNYSGALRILPTTDEGGSPANYGDWAHGLNIMRDGRTQIGNGGFELIGPILNNNNLRQGVWIPIDAGSQANAASVAYYTVAWSQVGKTVTLAGQVDVNTVAANTLTWLRMYLPTYYLYGNLTGPFGGRGTLTSAFQYESGYASVGPNAGHVDLIFVSTGVGNHAVFYSITYQTA